MKKVISILTLSIASVVGVAISSASSNTYALSYSDNIGVNFTLDQSLTVSLSSADIVINNLAPGGSSDSNIITINVLSNNLSGYELKSSVGNSTPYDTRNLTHSSSSSSGSNPSPSSSDAVFTSLDYGSSISSLDGSDYDNTWGYSYSPDNNTWSNYSGLPKYNDTTNVATLRTSTGPSSKTGDDTYFKIAAKASTSQPSGEYRNVINFTVTAEHNPASFYDAFKEAATKDPTITTLNGYYKMQDMSPSICESVELYDDDSHIQLIDTRDHEVYYIGKLRDDRCWLLDNLRLGSNDYEIPLTPEDTNIETAWTLPQGTTNGYSFMVPYIYASNKDNTNVVSYGIASSKIGVYYNYCATSAGTYCYDRDDGTGNAKYDVCPAGWRIPTGNTDGEYYALSSHYPNQDATSNDSLQHNLATPLAGRIGEGTITHDFNARGDYWASTYNRINGMSGFYVKDTVVNPRDNGLRDIGRTVRCIANN